MDGLVEDLWLVFVNDFATQNRAAMDRIWKFRTEARREVERGKEAALEWSVKLPTMGYSITHNDELLVEGTKRRIGVGNARMRRFMGNMVYLRLMGKSRRMEANRRGPRYSLSRFSFSRHLCEPRRVKSSRILTKKVLTMCNIPRWILTRCQARNQGATRRPRGSYDDRVLPAAFREPGR